MSRNKILFIFPNFLYTPCLLSPNTTLTSLSHLAFRLFINFLVNTEFFPDQKKKKKKESYFFKYTYFYPRSSLSSYVYLDILYFLLLFGKCNPCLHHVLYAGEYLALTGEKLNGVEMIACGLATHYSLSAVCPLGPFSLL